MTSLNGDAFVMRNGRSTSQVSIYNYPEHLNPFYEDEQHKRLRFWHINKSNGSGSRRSSFSLSGLKDVWAFKSFRLKKKSSTLGINKTSESPPPLRRDLQPYNTDNGNDLSLPDYRTRYSTPADGSFQRNAAYRSSLQNVALAKDNGGSQLDFNRNNQYRSTIQVMGTKSNNRNHNYNNNNVSSRTVPVPHPRRYVYGGSVTPQPLRNSDIGAGVGLTHGSSQISMASTNPFDTDDDDEENNEDVSLAGDRQIITSTPIKQRMHRKKRRAPAPPTIAVHKPNSSVVSSPDSSLDESPHPQPLPELRIEECMDIANLTAAIEDFVKTSNDDEPESIPVATNKKPIDQATQESASPSKTTAQNGDSNAVCDSLPPSPSQKEESINTVDTVMVEKEKSAKCVPSETKDGLEMKHTEVKNINLPKANTEAEVGHLECIHVHMGSPRNTTPTEHAEPNQLTSFRGKQTRSPEPRQPITTKTSFTLTTPPAVRRDSTRNAKIAMQTTETLTFPETDELRITEDVTTSKSLQSPRTTKPIVSAKPHIAEIHKPARGITSKNIKSDEHKDAVKENRQPPMSPVPPIRNHATVILTQASVVQPKETESELKIEQQKTEVCVLPSDTVPTTSTHSLTITESHEDLLDKDDTTSHISNDTKIINVSKTPHRTQSPTEMREEALESLYRPKPTTSYLEWKQSPLAPLEKSVPPEKRKSVKDIIESINRSQRLLNASAHKDAAHNGSSLSIGASNGNETPLPQRKFSGQSTIEKNVSGIKSHEHNGNSTVNGGHDADLPSTSATASLATDDNANLNGVASDLVQDPQKLNNNEIFKKCTVKKDVQYDYREQSPTTSNLDWNPVPKPKRNKNLLEQ
ncbi:general transcriptional corepressor trfA isoform X1 [Anastrepha ludens]|uniref:general transcriptional corepressor trfA isoform X1 n=1 Tax=Anastrepha ludens TaxID=28586 RepID=UPI0023B03A94|nr:general transcriptional corepressor trfA isoform X1 [Anastrepha ludens]XP_053957719.1 general transcriptional corepressor trfA isoform X1 [Anastrepha ludens]